MAAFIKRARNGVADPLHLEYHPTGHTQDFNLGVWIMNPDLAPVAAVDRKYWETVVDAVVEMAQVDKDAVDQAILDASNADAEARLNAGVTSDSVRDTTLGKVGWSVAVVGLAVTFDLETLVVAVQKTVTAHASLKTFVLGVLVYNTTSSAYNFVLQTKTGNIYSALAADESYIATIGEWHVVANGTDLVEETDGTVERNKKVHGKYIMVTESAVLTVSIADAELEVFTIQPSWETVGTVTIDVSRHVDPTKVKVEALGMLKTNSGDADIRVAWDDGTSSGAFGVDNITQAGALAITSYNKAPTNIPTGPAEYRLQARRQSAVSVTLRGWSLSFLHKEE